MDNSRRRNKKDKAAQRRGFLGRLMDRVLELPTLLSSQVQSEQLALAGAKPHYGVDKLEQRMLLTAVTAGEVYVWDLDGGGAGTDIGAIEVVTGTIDVTDNGDGTIDVDLDTAGDVSIRSSHAVAEIVDSAAVDATIVTGVSVDLDIANGDILADDASAETTAEALNGDLAASGSTIAEFDLLVAGSVLEGLTVNAVGADPGDVENNNAAGDLIDVDSVDGDVSIDGGSGQWVVRNSHNGSFVVGGDLADDFDGDSFVVENGDGSDATDFGTTTFQVDGTVDGNIIIDDQDGAQGNFLFGGDVNGNITFTDGLDGNINAGTNDINGAVTFDSDGGNDGDFDGTLTANTVTGAITAENITGDVDVADGVGANITVVADWNGDLDLDTDGDGVGEIGGGGTLSIGGEFTSNVNVGTITVPQIYTVADWLGGTVTVANTNLAAETELVIDADADDDGDGHLDTVDLTSDDTDGGDDFGLSLNVGANGSGVGIGSVLFRATGDHDLELALASRGHVNLVDIIDAAPGDPSNEPDLDLVSDFAAGFAVSGISVTDPTDTVEGNVVLVRNTSGNEGSDINFQGNSITADGDVIDVLADGSISGAGGTITADGDADTDPEPGMIDDNGGDVDAVRAGLFDGTGLITSLTISAPFANFNSPGIQATSNNIDYFLTSTSAATTAAITLAFGADPGGGFPVPATLTANQVNGLGAGVDFGATSRDANLDATPTPSGASTNGFDGDQVIPLSAGGAQTFTVAGISVGDGPEVTLGANGTDADDITGGGPGVTNQESGNNMFIDGMLTGGIDVDDRSGAVEDGLGVWNALFLTTVGATAFIEFEDIESIANLLPPGIVVPGVGINPFTGLLPAQSFGPTALDTPSTIPGSINQKVPAGFSFVQFFTSGAGEFDNFFGVINPGAEDGELNYSGVDLGATTQVDFFQFQGDSAMESTLSHDVVEMVTVGAATTVEYVQIEGDTNVIRILDGGTDGDATTDVDDEDGNALLFGGAQVGFDTALFGVFETVNASSFLGGGPGALPAAGVTSIIDPGLDATYGDTAADDDFVIGGEGAGGASAPGNDLGSIYIEGSTNIANAGAFAAGGGNTTLAVAGSLLGIGAGGAPVTNAIETVDIESGVGFIDSNLDGAGDSGAFDSDFQGDTLIGSSWASGAADIAGGYLNGAAAETVTIGLPKVSSIGGDGQAFEAGAQADTNGAAVGSLGTPAAPISIEVDGQFGNTQGVIGGGFSVGDVNSIDDSVVTITGGDGFITADDASATVVVNHEYALGSDNIIGDFNGGGGPEVDIPTAWAAGFAAGSAFVANGDATEESDDLLIDGTAHFQNSVFAGAELPLGTAAVADVVGQFGAGDDADVTLLATAGSYGTQAAPGAIVATGASPGDVAIDITTALDVTTLIAAGTGDGGSILGDISANTANVSGRGIIDTVAIADDNVGAADGSNDYVSGGVITDVALIAGATEVGAAADGVGDVLVDVLAGVTDAVRGIDVETAGFVWNGGIGDITNLLIRADGNTGHTTNGNDVAASDDITNVVIAAAGGSETLGGLAGHVIAMKNLAAANSEGGGFVDPNLDAGLDTFDEQQVNTLGDGATAFEGDAGESELFSYSVYAGAINNSSNGGNINAGAFVADLQVGRDGEGTDTIRADGDIVDLYINSGLNDGDAAINEVVFTSVLAGFDPNGALVNGNGDISVSGDNSNVIVADDNIGVDSTDGTIDDALIQATDDITNLILAAGGDAAFGITQMHMAGNTMGVPDAPVTGLGDDDGGNIFTSVRAGVGDPVGGAIGGASDGTINVIYALADSDVGASDGTDDIAASGDIIMMTSVAGFSNSGSDDDADGFIDGIGNFLLDVIAGVTAATVGLAIDQDSGALTSGSFDGHGGIIDIAVRADGRVGRVDGSSNIAAQDEIVGVTLIAEGREGGGVDPAGLRTPESMLNLAASAVNADPDKEPITQDTLAEVVAGNKGAAYMTILLSDTDDTGDDIDVLNGNVGDAGEVGAPGVEQSVLIDINAGADFDPNGSFANTALSTSDLQINAVVADANIGHSSAEGFNVWRADHDVDITYIDAGGNDVDDNNTESFLVSVYAGIEQDGTTVPVLNSVASGGVAPDMVLPGGPFTVIPGPAIFGDLKIGLLVADDNIGAGGQLENEGIIASGSIALNKAEAGGLVRRGGAGFEEQIFPDTQEFDDGGSFLVNMVAGWRGQNSTNETTQAGYLVDGAGDGTSALLDNDIDQGNLFIGVIAVDDDLGENPTVDPVAAAPHLPTFAADTGNVFSAAGGGLDGYMAIVIGKLLVGQSFTSLSGDSYGGASSVNGGAITQRGQDGILGTADDNTLTRSVGDMNVDIVAGVEVSTWDPIRANINDVSTSLPGGAYPQLAGGIGRINPQTGKPGVKGDVYNDDIKGTKNGQGMVFGTSIESAPQATMNLGDFDHVIRVAKNLTVNPLIGMPDMAPFIPDDEDTNFNPDIPNGESLGGFEGNGNVNSTILAGSDVEVNFNIRGNFVGRDGVGGRAVIAAASYLGDGDDGSGYFSNPNMLIIRTADPGEDWEFMTADDVAWPAIDGDFVGSLNSGAFVPFDNSGNNPFNENDRGPEQVGKVLTLGELKVGVDSEDGGMLDSLMNGSGYDGMFNVGRIRGEFNGTVGDNGITLAEALQGIETLADRTFLGTTTFSSTDDMLLNVFVMGRPFGTGEAVDLLGGQGAEGTVTPNPADGDVNALSVLSFGEITQGGFEKDGGADGTMGIVATDMIEFSFILSNVDAITAINTSDFDITAPVDQPSAPGDPSDPSTELALNVGMGGNVQGNDIDIVVESKGFGQGAIWGEMVAAGFDIFTRIDTGGAASANVQAPVGSVATAPKTPSFAHSFGFGNNDALLIAEDQDPTNGLEVGDIGLGFFGAGNDIDSSHADGGEGAMRAGLVAQDDIQFYEIGTIGGNPTDNDPFFLDYDGDGTADRDFDVAAGLNVNLGISPFAASGLFNGGENAGVFLAGDDIYAGRLEGSVATPPVVIPGDTFQVTIDGTNTANAFDTVGFFSDGSGVVDDTISLPAAFNPATLALGGVPAGATLNSVQVTANGSILPGTPFGGVNAFVAPFGVGSQFFENPSVTFTIGIQLTSITANSTITGPGVNLPFAFAPTVSEVGGGTGLALPQNRSLAPGENVEFIVEGSSSASGVNPGTAAYTGNGTVDFTLTTNGTIVDQDSNTGGDPAAANTAIRDPQFGGDVTIVYNYSTNDVIIPGTPGGKQRVIKEDKVLFTVQGNGTPSVSQGSFDDSFRLVSGIEDQLTGEELFNGFENFVGTELEIDDDDEDGVLDGPSGNIDAELIAGDDFQGIIDAGDVLQRFNGYFGRIDLNSDRIDDGASAKMPGGKLLGSGVVEGDWNGLLHAGAGIDLNILTSPDNDLQGNIGESPDDGSYIYAGGTINVEDMNMPGPKGGILAEDDIEAEIVAGFSINGGNLLGNVVAEETIHHIEVFGSLGRAGFDSVIYAGHEVENFFIGDDFLIPQEQEDGDYEAVILREGNRHNEVYNGDNEPQLGNADFGIVYSDILFGGVEDEEGGAQGLDVINLNGSAGDAELFVSNAISDQAAVVIGLYRGFDQLTISMGGGVRSYHFDGPVPTAGVGLFVFEGGNAAPDIYAYDATTFTLDNDNETDDLEGPGADNIDLEIIGAGMGPGLGSAGHIVALDGVNEIHIVNGGVERVTVDDDYDIETDLDNIRDNILGTAMFNMFPFFTNSLPPKSALNFAANNAKNEADLENLNVEFDIGTAGLNNLTGLLADKSNYAVFVEGDIEEHITSEDGSVGNVVVGRRIHDSPGLVNIWDADVDDIGVAFLVDAISTDSKMTVLANNGIFGEQITVVIPADVNAAEFLNTGVIDTGDGGTGGTGGAGGTGGTGSTGSGGTGNGGTGGTGGSGAGGATGEVNIEILPDGNQAITVTETGDGGITFVGVDSGPETLVIFGAGDGQETILDAETVTMMEAMGSKVLRDAEPNSAIALQHGFAADFFARNNIGDIHVTLGGAIGHPQAVVQGRGDNGENDLNDANGQFIEDADNQFVTHTGSMGVLHVRENIDNPTIDVFDSLGGLIAERGTLDTTIKPVHVNGSIGLLQASGDITGTFEAEEGDIGVDLNLADKFTTVTRQETTDAGIFSDIGDIAITATAGGDIGNTGSFVNTIDSDYIAGGSIGNLTAGHNLFGSYRAVRGEIGNATALTGDIGEQDDRASFVANGGVEIDPATLQPQHILNGEFNDGIGSIISEIGNIYANVRTGTSVGIQNGNDVQGGIAAPIGNVEVALNIGQHLGGISGASVSIDEGSVILGTTGVVRGADEVNGATAHIDADNDLLISVDGVDHVVDISNGSAWITYSVADGEVTFDDILYSPAGGSGSLNVKTVIFAGGAVQVDSDVVTTVNNLDVDGSLTDSMIEANVDSLSISGDATNVMVEGHVTTLTIGGSTTNVEVGSVTNLNADDPSGITLGDGGDALALLNIDPANVDVERITRSGTRVAAGGNVVLTGNGDLLVSSVVTGGGERVVTSITSLSAAVNGLLVQGRVLSIDTTVDGNEFDALVASEGGDVAKAQRKINRNNGANLTDVTVNGNVDQIIARTNINRLTVTGEAGVIDAGGSITNSQVNGDVNVLKAARNISGTQVLGNAGSVSAGSQFSRSVIAGSAIQVSSAFINTVDIAGSVGIGIDANGNLSLGAAFSPTTAATVLGIAVGADDAETLDNLFNNGDVGPNGGRFLGGIGAQQVQSTSVGGAISDLIIERRFNGGDNGLTNNVVDDAFVVLSPNTTLIQTDGVIQG